MTAKIKLHDGIIGALVLFTTLMGWKVDPRWLALSGVIAAVMISSAFTGFCPVHYLVGRWVRG